MWRTIKVILRSAAECRACESVRIEMIDLERGKMVSFRQKGRTGVGSFARTNVQRPQAKEAEK
jgi:hypothetical protein